MAARWFHFGRLLPLCLLSCCFDLAASLRLQDHAENRTLQQLPWSGEEEASLFDEPTAAEPLPSNIKVDNWVPADLNFNSRAGDLKEFAKRQRLAEDEPTHLGPGMDIVFSEVGGECNQFVRPFADFDTSQGHGNPRCRYEPSLEDLRKYEANPIDLAILLSYSPAMKRWGSFKAIEEHSASAWRAYAARHGYAFYEGEVHGGDPSCFELLGQAKKERRSLTWLKVCVALQLIKKHKYLLVVDGDTVALKPRLRMEPLFEKAGLLEDTSEKVLAVTSEWGSCAGAQRRHHSGAWNTGMFLVKNTAEELLKTWYFNSDCRGDCKLYNASKTKWSWDQLGFDASVARTHGANITVWPPGCPINSPWGDFIAHFVSGSFDLSYYNYEVRDVVVAAASRCATGLLGQSGADPYERCSVCDVLPPGTGGFNVSCAPGRPQ